MRKRSRPKVVWLPGTNANSINNSNTTVQEFSVDVSGADGDLAVGEIPLVIDVDQDPVGAADVSLSDIFNSGYRLRRIVGKIYATATQVAADTPCVTLITAGLIIRRADNTGTSLALQAGNGINLAPDDIENQSDPWIWRRSWILRNNLATSQSARWVGINGNNVSATNGSAVDGPHVDVKTARIVSQEERLFLDVSSRILEQGGNQALALSTRILADLRVLASMKTSYGNRRNASR